MTVPLATLLYRRPKMARTKALLEALPDAAIVVDQCNTIVTSNDAAQCVAPEHLQPKQMLAAAWPELHHVIDQGQTLLAVHNRTFSVHQKTSRNQRIILLHDVTPLDERHQKLEANINKLKKQNAALDAFGHTVAHDLQAPLSLIVGYSEMLYQADDSETLEAYRPIASRLKQAGLTMGDMVKNLLLLSHVDHAEGQAGPTNMDEVIQRAIMRFDFELNQRDITIDVATGLPQAFTHGPWVEEVVANLVSNSIKYIGAENDSPCIRIEASHLGSHIRYQVIDNGIGIHPADQARLWEMFNRVKGTPSGGMGLGLSIVQRIITKLGGEVGVESNPGAGSNFWFTLPTSHQQPAVA